MSIDTFIKLWKVRNLSSFPTALICSSQSDFWPTHLKNGNLVKIGHNAYKVSDDCKQRMEKAFGEMEKSK